MKINHQRILVLGAVIGLACGEPTEPDVASLRSPLPAQLEIISGDRQTDTVARDLATPVRIRVRDAQSRVLPGQLVNFVITQGGGAVFAPAVQTDDAGIAQNRWTLGTIAGEQLLEVRAIDDAGTPVVFGTVIATAIPGAVDSVYLAQGIAGFAGEPLAIAAGAYDRYANPIPHTLTSSTLTVNGGLVTPASVGLHELALTVRGAVRATRTIAAFLDPRPLGLMATYRCRGGVGAYDSIQHTREKLAGTWEVEPGTNSQVWMLGTERAMWSSERWERIRWFSDGTVDTVTTTREEQQFISILAAGAAPDTLDWSPSPSGQLPARVAADRWEQPMRHPGCEGFASGDPFTVTAQ